MYSGILTVEGTVAVDPERVQEAVVFRALLEEADVAAVLEDATYTCTWLK